MSLASAAQHGASASDGFAVPSVFLARLLEASGVEFDHERHAGAVRPRESLPGSWQEALEWACTPHPLRLRRVFLSAREACAAAARRTPLVGHGAPEGGAPGFVALIDRGSARNRGLVLMGEAGVRWLSPEELAAALGQASAEVPVPWLLVEPELPCLSAATRPGGHGLPPLRRLLQLVRPDRADLGAIVLFAILIGGLTLATPIAVQQLVNTVAFGGLVQPVVVVALLLFGGLAFSALLSVLQAYVAESLQRRVFVRVAVDLADRLPRVDADAFSTRHGPEVVNRVFDVFTVQKTGAALLLEGTSVVLQTIVGLVVLSFYHPLMLGFSILLVIGIAVVGWGMGRRAVDTAIGESHAKYAVVEWMEELARHPSVFRHPGAHEYATERADRLASAWIGARRRHYRIVLRQLSGALGLQVLAGSALLALGGGLVVAGQLTLGQLVASELIITAIVSAVAKLGKQLESLYDLLAAVDKLGVLFDLPLERDDGSPAEPVERPASVRLRDVGFRYGARRTVLDHFSLDIEPGERVLLTGPAGAGKSTLVDLMLGLRAPSSGFVALDGHDLRDFRLRDLREQVVCVREPEIFSGTILDNVRIARPWLSQADVRDALEAVGLLEPVRALPEGLLTRLSTNGDPLSDGEVASLMLARAIVARPRLLILDEALVQLEPAERERALDTLFAEDAPWTIVAASDLEEVRRRCGRVVDMSRRARTTAPHPGDAP